MSLIPLDTRITGPVNAFGDLRTGELVGAIQVDAIYGILTDTVETFTGNDIGTDGTATAADSMFSVTTTTTVGGYGVIRSLRSARYRPGSGILARFTAIFDSDNAVPLSLQFAGMFALEPALAFGYDGEDFGILRRHGGAAEIRTLTISAAPTGAETVTVTLNGTAANVAVTSGTAPEAAWEISQGAFPGWRAQAVSNTVVFQAESVGGKSDTYSVSSTGALEGSFAQGQAGAAHTYDWTYQSAWNLDRLDGTGGPVNPSGMTLDPSKGNVYEIQAQWLGFGAITFSVEDDETGQIRPVHRIRYANLNTTPSVSDPSFKVGWVAASLGSSGSDITVKGASAAIYHEGVTQISRNPRGATGSRTTVGTTYEPIVAIENVGFLNNKISQRQVRALLATVAVDGTKPAEAALFLNPTFAGKPTWAYRESGVSTVVYSTDGTTVSGGTELASLGLGRLESDRIDLAALGIVLRAGDILVLAVRATTGNTDVTGSFTWVED